MPLHNEDGSLITEGVHEIALPDPIVENSQYVVRAHVVDSYGCHGEDGNFTYLVGMFFRILEIYQQKNTYWFVCNKMARTVAVAFKHGFVEIQVRVC